MSTRLAEVGKIALEGGRLALELRGSLTAEVKDDGSFVTNADVAVQDLVLEKLRVIFPGVAIVAEENEEIPAGRPDSFLAVDPIDGTDSYQRGFPHFGVSIGLVENGRCALGVFYSPVLQELYAVDAREPPTLNGREFRILASDRHGPLLVPSDFHLHYATSRPGKVRCYGSMVHHLCYVACGRAIGTLAYSTHIWDLAAGVALAEAAGARFAMLSGDPFMPADYLDGRKIMSPMLAAPDFAWDELRDSFSSVKKFKIRS